MKRRTDKTELVETHNLALSLRRLYNGQGGYDDGKWKRALYHALAMGGNVGNTMLKAIREALGLA
jgi:hypothetical protein